MADGTGSVSLPLMTLSGTWFGHSGAVNLGNTSNLNPSDSTPLTLTATALGSPVYTGALTLNAVAMAADASLEGPLALPALQLEAELATGNAGTGACSVYWLDAAATLLNGGEAVGTINLPRLLVAGEYGTAGDIDLPAPALAATLATGQLGWASLLLQGVELDALMLTDAVASAALELVPPNLDATGLTGRAGQGDLLLEAPDLAASGWQEGTGQGDAELAAATVAGLLATGGVATGNAVLAVAALAAAGTSPPPDNSCTGQVELAAPLLAALAFTGPLASAAITLPLASLAAQAAAEGRATGALQLPGFTLAALATGSPVAEATVQLAALTLAADAVAGTTGSAELTLPLLQADTSGHLNPVGSAQIVLPLLLLDGVLVQTVASPVFSSVVMNTRTRAVSTYQGVAANSLCQFGGLTLAATASGIVALIGDTDLGAPIEASVTGAVGELGSEAFKRVLAGYVGYRADGDLELTLITDGHHEYSYRLVARQVGEQHGTRVKFGRGMAGRYWQWKLANQNGAGFALDALGLEVQPLERGV